MEEERESRKKEKDNVSARLDDDAHLNAMRAEALKQEMLSFIQKKRKEMENSANATAKLRPAVFASPPTVSPDASCPSVPRSQFVPPQSRYMSSHATAPPPLPSIHRPTIWKLHKWKNWDSKEFKPTPQDISYYESFLNASLDANNPEAHKHFIIQDQFASSPRLQFVPIHSVFLRSADDNHTIQPVDGDHTTEPASNHTIQPADDNYTKNTAEESSLAFSTLPPTEPKKKKKKKKKKKATSELAPSDDSSSQSADDETPRHALLRSISHAWRKYARRLKETPVEAGQLSLDAAERIFYRDHNCPFESRRLSTR